MGEPAKAGAAASSLAGLVSRSRLAPIPFEDVSRLQGSAVALTLEADVNASLANLDNEQQRDYDRLALAYPFEARGAEVVVVPDRSCRRAGDLVALLGSPSMGAVERVGFEVPRTHPRNRQKTA